MRKAFRFILLLGIVSLFADITYEGARSITGPYLALLGATGAAVGTVVGFGEFVGYGLRVVSGYISDRTRWYWTLTFVGFFINLAAVPLLALVGSWQGAAALIILERLGKAIRVPSRDTLLSYATRQAGRGWGFGIHEALDQVGAIVGPLLMAAMLFFQQSYRVAFATLGIPAVIAFVFLILTKVNFPRPQEMEPTPRVHVKGFSPQYWIYLIAISFVAAGYVDFALIAFHFKKSATVESTWIPFFYAIAMAVAGLSALIMGRLFDRKGISVLAIVTAISAFFSPFLFWGHFYGALFGMVLWGIGMGSQESILRAYVAELTPPEKRGSAYGIMNFFFGLFWALGSALMGFFYDISLPALVTFSVAAQLIAIPLFLSFKKNL